MPERPAEWHPTEDEVSAILDELRPLIRRFAELDRYRLEIGSIIARYG